MDRMFCLCPVEYSEVFRVVGKQIKKKKKTFLSPSSKCCAELSLL